MSVVLLISATVLGFLAFFEPCTIATHTLFAARLGHETAHRRSVALSLLMLSRTMLLMMIFGMAAWVGLDGFSTNIAVTMLVMMGAIYLLSRRVYLPVPHVEFYRLIPFQGQVPQALKLGLTLPACTLPLVVVVGILSALSRQTAMAMLAGLAFAAMFSLPTLWHSTHQLDATQRVLLGKAASLSPYFTTLLLWGGAFLIWKTGV